MFHGITTALITPFKNGKVDEESYRRHIEWQIEQGIHALLPCGTTGESATLSHEEHEEVIRICINQVNGRVPVLAGAGSNNTNEAIRLTQFAKDSKAQAALHITPYYNKPSQEGLFQHYKAIHDAVDIPLFVYNVPSRTGVNVQPKTIARIYKELPRVIGIKEAVANMIQLSDMIEFCGRDICLISGDDFTFLPSLALGAKGIISVTSNVAPKLMVDLYNAFIAGDIQESQRLHYLMQELNRALFIDVNPVPTKKALSLMGFMSDELRLPLFPLSDEHTEIVKKGLQSVGIKV